MTTQSSPALIATSAEEKPVVRKSRVIFLDVDGVLCSARAHLTLGHPKGDRIWNAWDPVAVEAIKLACAKDVRIVVSSTWRMDHKKDTLFAKLAEHNMLRLLRQPDWRTPEMDRQFKLRDGTEMRVPKTRGDEIAFYLGANPDIGQYRIVDDDSDLLPEQMPYFIHTDGEDGMTTDNIRSLLRWSGYLKS